MPTTLLTLPPELLHQITTFLAPSSRLSLHLTSRSLHDAILPCACKTPSSTCETTAGRRILAASILAKTNQRECVLCGGIFASTMFHHPELPICHWHEGWFMAADYRQMWLETELKETLDLLARSRFAKEEHPVWVAVMRTFCAHSKDILRWHVWDDGRSSGCESCGRWEVACYVRLPPIDLRTRREEGEGHLTGWNLSRNDGGESPSFVVEEVEVVDGGKFRVEGADRRIPDEGGFEDYRLMIETQVKKRSVPIVSLEDMMD